MGNYSIRGYNEAVFCKCEVEWLYRLMPSTVLLQLKDIIEFAIKEKEYERCLISGGGMRYLIQMIEDELKIREMEKTGITYKEASEQIIKERTPKLEEEGKGIDDTSNGTNIDTTMDEGRTDSTSI